ncbi:MAG: methyltransferase domain-containing protein [Parasphingorhabdus sp.]
MTATDNISEIFDRSRRRTVRDRAYVRAHGEDFLHKEMADELYDRLQLVSRSFNRCLLIGLGSQYLANKLRPIEMHQTIADSSYLLSARARGVQCDEDRLPFADASFDLVISIGGLDTVNDLPGALSLIRRVLKPDGLFLGAFIGAESLTTLKSTLLEAEGDRVRNHIHPQIDIRTMGDLLQRTGFALPVVDSDTLKLRYGMVSRLIDDIRDFGGGNLLRSNIQPIQRSVTRFVPEFFTNRADEQGKTTEYLEVIQVSGWAPHPDQPKAAPRGSGQLSLKNALNDRS